MKQHIRMAIVSIACLSMLACVTVQPLAVERAQLSQTLHPGDRVQVVTVSGQRATFKVENIDADGLHGAGQHIAFSDIQSISREKVSLGRTSLIAVGIAALAGLAVGGASGGSGY